MAGERMVRGVLFDVDGTLIDSTYLHTLAWWQAFRRSGRDVAMASIHRCIGMGGDKLIAHLLGEGVDQAEEELLSSTHGAVFGTYWPSLRTFDGSREILEKCRQLDLEVVLASSAKEPDMKALRAALDADEWISAATGSADADQSKPDPDILAAALKAGGLRAEDTVFVGDAVWDVYASAKLGIPCIGLTCGGTSEAELLEAGAVEVYRDPRALLGNLSDSRIGRLLA